MDPLLTVLLICEMWPPQCSEFGTRLQPHTLRNGTHLMSFYYFTQDSLTKILTLEWDPLFIVLFICEMGPLLCSRNSNPLTTARFKKLDPLIFL
jgi:hypothetical protein